MAITAIYVDADTFTVTTDRTSEFSVGRRVKCDCGVDGDKIGTILSSAYTTLTTVNLTTASADLTSNLTEVEYGIQSEGSSGSVPEHDHVGGEGSGGIVSQLGAPDGSPNPVLGVDANGDVGIGTSTPDAKLEVAGLINTEPLIISMTNALAVDDTIGLSFKRTDSFEIAKISSFLGSATNSGGLKFYTAPDGDGAVVVMTINYAGSVSLLNGTGINEFSSDGTMAGNSNSAVPTEQAIVEYVPKDNILINQDFSIWQENTTFTNPATGVYTADGYYVNKAAGEGTSPTINVKKNTANMETGFAQCCELEITNVGISGVGRYYYFVQKVENFENYRGKTITISTRIKSSAVITAPDARISLYDGVASAHTVITYGTDWTTFSATLTVDDNATVLTFYFVLFNGPGVLSTTCSVYIQWMKVELGSITTALIPRKTGEELALCQRYYQKSYAQGVFAGTSSSIGQEEINIAGLPSAIRLVYKSTRLPVVMKAAPTVLLYSPVTGSLGVRMSNGDMSGSADSIADSGFRVYATDTPAVTVGYLSYHYTAISRI